MKKGEETLKYAYEKYPKSREVLRALGWMYFERCKKGKAESNLKMAIDFFRKNVDTDSENAMPFDLTALGYVHIKSYTTDDCENMKLLVL